jgi:nicotinate-nucleotide adenylyltransferase
LRVAIYGGSFDPPHLGHVEVVKKGLEKLEIDRFILLPNYRNPWKKSFHFSPEKRVELLEKSFEDIPKVEVSRFEVENGRPTLTIESIRHFSKIYEKIYLIIGADNLEKREKWDEFEEIDSMVTWVVATRDDIPVPKEFLKLETAIPISSTQLREKMDLEFLPKEIRDMI